MTLEHPAYGLLRPVTETASVLLCDNPGLLTLDGTNTWVLQGPGSDEMVIVDPGPEDDEHIDRIAELGKIPLVLISHKHEDHTGAHRQDRRPHRRGGPLGGQRLPAGPRRAADRRRGHRCGGSAHHGDGHAGAYRGLGVVPARRRGADRRHGARPRHDRHRQGGRQPAGLPGIAAAAARRRPSDGPAGPRPGSRRPGSGQRHVPGAPRGATRSGARGAARTRRRRHRATDRRARLHRRRRKTMGRSGMERPSPGGLPTQ